MAGKAPFDVPGIVTILWGRSIGLYIQARYASIKTAVTVCARPHSRSTPAGLLALCKYGMIDLALLLFGVIQGLTEAHLTQAASAS